MGGREERHGHGEEHGVLKKSHPDAVMVDTRLLTFVPSPRTCDPKGDPEVDYGRWVTGASAEVRGRVAELRRGRGSTGTSVLLGTHNCLKEKKRKEKKCLKDGLRHENGSVHRCRARSSLVRAGTRIHIHR